MFRKYDHRYAICKINQRCLPWHTKAKQYIIHHVPQQGPQYGTLGKNCCHNVLFAPVIRLGPDKPLQEVTLDLSSRIVTDIHFNPSAFNSTLFGRVKSVQLTCNVLDSFQNIHCRWRKHVRKRIQSKMLSAFPICYDE